MTRTATGLALEYATLSWNVVGTVVVMVAGIAAGSVALVGFGLDSAIEIIASTVVIWQMRDTVGTRERPALITIGVAFCVLAVYIAGQAIYTLASGGRPGTSSLGIAWTAATFLAMLALATGKGRVGRELGNPVLLTESRVTLVDAYLACAVMVGLILNSLFGWWWADPLAGLVIVAYALKECSAVLNELRR